MPNEQRVAVCYSQWREEGAHPDFQRILTTFLNWFKDGSGYDKFREFIGKNRLDIAKPYRPSAQFAEGFQWLEPEIRFLKQDKEAKYYALKALTANISMNDSDYRDWQKLVESAPSLQVKPVNYNHDHSRWLPFPRTRVELVGPEDLTIECLLRVDNADRYLQQQLDHDPSIPSGKWINHPSVEGFKLHDGHRDFMGIGLLEVDGPQHGMPGDPLTEIHSLVFEEGIRDELCKIVDGKVVCEPCQTGEPSSTEVNKVMAEPQGREEKGKGTPNPSEAAMDAEKILRLSEANLKLQGELASTRNQVVEAQRASASLQTQLSQKETRIIELEGLETVVKSRDQTILSLQGELSNMKSRLDNRISEAVGTERDYVDRIAKLKEEHSQEVAAIKKEQEGKLVDLQRKHEDENRQRTERMGQLEKQANKAEEEAKRLEGLKAVLEGQCDNLRKDVDSLSSKATDANEYSRKAIKDRSEMQAELAGLRDEAAKLTRKNAELTEKLADKAKSDYTMSLDKEKMSEAIAERDQKITRLERQVHDIVRALKKQNKYVLDEEGRIIDA